MRILPILLVGVAALISVPTLAASSAGDLLAACTSAPESQGDIICNAYINGFVSGILNDQIATEGNHPICVDNTNTGEVRAALTKYLKDHSAILVGPSGAITGLAFQNLYPCKKSN